MKQRYNTLIIGTGCAGYNAADKLFDLGVTDIAIITEGRYMGTSRNTGSDSLESSGSSFHIGEWKACRLH